MERKSLALFFLLFIALASQMMVVPTEARVCEAQSHKYHGMKVSLVANAEDSVTVVSVLNFVNWCN
ncbi:defensin-like protein 1 [Fagus crenata]